MRSRLGLHAEVSLTTHRSATRSTTGQILNNRDLVSARLLRAHAHRRRPAFGLRFRGASGRVRDIPRD